MKTAKPEGLLFYVKLAICVYIFNRACIARAILQTVLLVISDLLVILFLQIFENIVVSVYLLVDHTHLWHNWISLIKVYKTGDLFWGIFLPVGIATLPLYT